MARAGARVAKTGRARESDLRARHDDNAASPHSRRPGLLPFRVVCDAAVSSCLSPRGFGNEDGALCLWLAVARRISAAGWWEVGMM